MLSLQIVLVEGARARQANHNTTTKLTIDFKRLMNGNYTRRNTNSNRKTFDSSVSFRCGLLKLDKP